MWHDITQFRLGQLSNGKLDVTVGPLVNLWGFGPEYRPETVPTDTELNETRQKTGLSNLVLEGNKLSKKIPNLRPLLLLNFCPRNLFAINHFVLRPL